MIEYLEIIKNVHDGTPKNPVGNYKYSDKEKAKFISKAKEIDNLSEAAKVLGLPYKTLYNWMRG